MDAVVVYESLFGNTRTIAEAVAAGVREADPGAQVTPLPVKHGQATPGPADSDQ
jgi:flavorubredoxin